MSEVFRPSSAVIEAALEAGERARGATAPNPPVAAAAWDEQGHLLLAAAHEKAGAEHAEAKLIRLLREQGKLERARGLFVTLEPCNHHGKTPPCTHAIRDSGIRYVAYAERDPNPQVLGGGAEALEAHGIWVERIDVPEAREQLAPWIKKIRTGLPWIVVKQAFDRDGSMIPPKGQKTFTSEESLKQAHRLRRTSDAIVTTAKTILNDHPELNVRKVEDHAGKKREVVIALSRDPKIGVEQTRALMEWMREAPNRGLLPMLRPGAESLDELMNYLGTLDAIQVLVEVGPTFSEAWLKSRHWDERWAFETRAGQPDRVTRSLRVPTASTA